VVPAAVVRPEVPAAVARPEALAGATQPEPQRRLPEEQVELRRVAAPQVGLVARAAQPLRARELSPAGPAVAQALLQQARARARAQAAVAQAAVAQAGVPPQTPP
jgi:hypothetical protein